MIEKDRLEKVLNKNRSCSDIGIKLIKSELQTTLACYAEYIYAELSIVEIASKDGYDLNFSAKISRFNLPIIKENKFL